ncbi:MAG TPA: hypothetical protein DDW52_01950 [Planctomycetaceae bacterium]|nr:hypothetical protein [Planctomycetaceae bacterium]
MSQTARSLGSQDSGFSENGSEVYQSVSRAGIASVVMGLLAFGSFWFLFLVLLAVTGLIFGIIALRDFKRFPEELVGRPFAQVGVGLCGLLLIAVPTFHTVVYLTEVPEGYTRVNFAKLTASKNSMQKPTDFAISINGDPIFIKGYIHPSSMATMRAKKFIIVPDLGTCCFGGQPDLTHMIEVTLEGDQYATKSLRKQRLAGTLSVNQQLKRVDELEGVFYQLKADIIK